ncbi:MAG: Ig-like domain-containing protein, partial [Acidobacteriota bacterium]
MRRRRSRFPASALAGLLLFGSAAGSSELSVRFIDPPPDVPLFNLVEVAAEVTSTERVDRVEFFLGGELVEVDRSPPYRAVIDVGDENLERRLAVVAHSSSGTRARAELVAPAIRVDETVDLPLQQLYVTATDESGEPVLDLTQDDFSVLDLGQEEELVTFTRGNVPLTIALLIDASESMRGERLDIALEAAQRFAARLGALDEAQVVVFSDRIHRIS